MSYVLGSPEVSECERTMGTILEAVEGKLRLPLWKSPAAAVLILLL